MKCRIFLATFIFVTAGFPVKWKIQDLSCNLFVFEKFTSHDRCDVSGRTTFSLHYSCYGL